MQLAESYKLLEEMTDYRNSPSCKEKHVCSLSDGKDTFSAKYQQEPGVSGPLKVGNSLVDAFTCSTTKVFRRIRWRGAKLPAISSGRCCQN